MADIETNREKAIKNPQTTPENNINGNDPHDGQVTRSTTLGGHPLDKSQPGLPVIHRKVGTPLVPAVMSFANVFWVLGMALLHARHMKQQSIYIVAWCVHLCSISISTIDIYRV
jgi:hypothetical protein